MPMYWLLNNALCIFNCLSINDHSLEALSVTLKSSEWFSDSPCLRTLVSSSLTHILSMFYREFKFQMVLQCASTQQPSTRSAEVDRQQDTRVSSLVIPSHHSVLSNVGSLCSTCYCFLCKSVCMTLVHDVKNQVSTASAAESLLVMTGVIYLYIRINEVAYSSLDKRVLWTFFPQKWFKCL